MALSRRYTPEIAPGELCVIGMDFSRVIPPGVGIGSGSLTIFTNTVPPVAAAADWALEAVSVRGRVLYTTINPQYSAAGKDYQLRWEAIDTDGNVWPRTALALCSDTS